MNGIKTSLTVVRNDITKGMNNILIDFLYTINVCFVI